MPRNVSPSRAASPRARSTPRRPEPAGTSGHKPARSARGMAAVGTAVTAVEALVQTLHGRIEEQSQLTTACRTEAAKLTALAQQLTLLLAAQQGMDVPAMPEPSKVSASIPAPPSRAPPAVRMAAPREQPAPVTMQQHAQAATPQRSPGALAPSLAPAGRGSAPSRQPAPPPGSPARLPSPKPSAPFISPGNPSTAWASHRLGPTSSSPSATAVSPSVASWIQSAAQQVSAGSPAAQGRTQVTWQSSPAATSTPHSQPAYHRNSPGMSWSPSHDQALLAPQSALTQSPVMWSPDSAAGSTSHYTPDHRAASPMRPAPGLPPPDAAALPSNIAHDDVLADIDGVLTRLQSMSLPR